MYTLLINLISKKIFLVNEDNESLEALWCRYFIEVILTNVIKTLLIFLVALLLNVFFTTITCEIVFLSLRKYSGGWHANNSWHCSILSITFLVLIPYLLMHMVTFSARFSLILILISLIILNISILTGDKDYQTNKIVSVNILMAVYSIILMYFQIHFIKVAILSGIFSQSFLVLISILKERRCKNEYKEKNAKKNEYLG